MAEALGCARAPDVAACLRQLPAETLADAKPQRRGLTGLDAWAPMHGGDVLPAPPSVAIEQAQQLQVPLLIGSNRNEGRLFAQLLSYAGKLNLQSSYEARVHRMYVPRTPASRRAGNRLWYGVGRARNQFGCGGSGVCASWARKARRGEPRNSRWVAGRQ
jgi:para-nitrobenzyl esterase